MELSFSKWLNEDIWAALRHGEYTRGMEGSLERSQAELYRLRDEYENIGWKDPIRGKQLQKQIHDLETNIDATIQSLKRSEPEDIYVPGVRVNHPKLGNGTVIEAPHERGTPTQIKFDNGETRYVDQGFIKPLPKALQNR